MGMDNPVNQMRMEGPTIKKCTCDTHKTCQIHNPLTDNVPAMNDKWTPEIAASIYGRGAYPFCELSDAHNTALEAAYRQGRKDGGDAACAFISEQISKSPAKTSSDSG